ALRGFALFGILLANLYSFIGYNTYSPEEIVGLPTGDRAVLFFIDWFVEGKFYGIFSILFGIGFALQAERFRLATANFSTFWLRRMMVLCGMGLMHMYFIWNGDILTLYSLLGMLLLLFVDCSDRTLFRWIIVLLLIPLLIHVVLYLTPDAPFWGSMRRFSSNLKTQWGFGALSLLEMRTSESAQEVFAINFLAAIPRAMSYLMSGRYFQVLGLFLIGLLLARHWLPRIRDNKVSVPRSAIWIGLIGLITSFGYAIIKAKIGTPFELSQTGLLQAVLYHLGSTSLALGIAMLFTYWWASGRAKAVFQNLSFLGRMALTNYIFQNVIAILLFFGYGFALMRKVPFTYLPFFAFSILLLQWLFSRAWLRRFRQGPLEYLWRQLSYGRTNS
ncbi:MAG: DUF418 domain-containing protein, partial [Bacteroidota bacterium]